MVLKPTPCWVDAYLYYFVKIYLLNKLIIYSGQYNLYAFQSLSEFIIEFIFLKNFLSSSVELYIIALLPSILICSKSPQIQVIIGLFLVKIQQ